MNQNIRKSLEILEEHKEALKDRYPTFGTLVEMIKGIPFGGQASWNYVDYINVRTKEILGEMPLEVVETVDAKYSTNQYRRWKYRIRVFDTQEETNAWKYKRLEKRLESLMQRGIVLPEDEKEAVEIDREMEKLRGGAIPHV